MKGYADDVTVWQQLGDTSFKCQCWDEKNVNINFNDQKLVVCLDYMSLSEVNSLCDELITINCIYVPL